MARSYGSRSQFHLAFESTDGTAPGSGYLKLPFARSGLRDAQERLESELLGNGADPLDSVLDGLTVGGDMQVPVDTVAIGHWLKAILGAPTTTGSGPYTPTFVSAANSIPSFSAEVGSPEVPVFDMHSGCRAGGFTLPLRRQGLLSMTVPVLGRKHAKATSTASGTPTTITPVRFSGFQGSITLGGSDLASIQSAELVYSNGLEAVDTIRPDGLIEGIDPTMRSLGITLETRFADTSLLDAAIAGTPVVLAFALTISASLSLTFTAERVLLPRPSREISGPGGIMATFRGIGAKGSSPARMMTVVLVNSTASYA